LAVIKVCLIDFVLVIFADDSDGVEIEEGRVD